MAIATTHSPRPERYKALRRVTAVGAVTNLGLAVVKTIFGFAAGSQALIADGLHSFADLATDLVVWLGAKHGSQDADEDHPYGHARIETAFTVALGAVLIAVALGLIVDAGQRLLEPERLRHPGAIAMLVAAMSIATNEWLYRYTIKAARLWRSPLLRANAWHHRSDAISSIVVVVGVAGTLLGFPYLDAFAAAGVALMIAKIGWDQAWSAAQELVDKGLEPAQLEAIRSAIVAVDGVRDLHMLRSRLMGGSALVDVHIQVSPRLSVSEGHQIGEAVRAALLQAASDVSDVTVHVDPEDDAVNELNVGLPLRDELSNQLAVCWRSLIDAEIIRQSMTLHYLDGKIDVEVVLPLASVAATADAQALSRQLVHAAGSIPQLGRVTVLFT